MSGVVIDAKYVQDWVVVDVPAGGGPATFKTGVVLTFSKGEVQAFFASTGLDSPGTYSSGLEDPSSLTVTAPYGKRSMKYVLNGDGTGTAQDLTDPKTIQVIKATTPPISNTTGGSGGSDITGLVVFLALIIGFVAFLNERK